MATMSFHGMLGSSSLRRAFEASRAAGTWCTARSSSAYAPNGSSADTTSATRAGSSEMTANSTNPARYASPAHSAVRPTPCTLRRSSHPRRSVLPKPLSAKPTHSHPMGASW